MNKLNAPAKLAVTYHAFHDFHREAYEKNAQAMDFERLALWAKLLAEDITAAGAKFTDPYFTAENLNKRAVEWKERAEIIREQTTAK